MSPEFRTSVAIASVVLTYNIAPLLTIPAIVLGIIWLMAKAIEDNPSIVTDLYFSNDKDTQSTQPLQTISTTPTANPFVNTMFISAAEKATYMKSATWSILKRKRLIVSGGKCESCGSTEQLELHHTTYQRLTCELLEDVRMQCNSCHTALHKELGYDRQTYYQIKVLT